MAMEGSLSTVTDVDALPVSPAASVTVNEKDAVPVPEAVHVGALAVVLENDPDAPVSDHEYEYGVVPPLTDGVRVIDCPISIEVLDGDIPVTDNAEFTVIDAVPDVPLYEPESVIYQDLEPVELKV